MFLCSGGSTCTRSLTKPYAFQLGYMLCVFVHCRMCGKCVFTFINDYETSRSNRWYRWALAHLLFTLSASDKIARIIFACR